MLKLRRCLGWVITLMVIGIAAITVPSTPAIAAPDVPEGCWTEEYKDKYGKVTIVVRCPEGVGNNPGTGGDDDGGGGNAEPIGDRECTYGPGTTVECETSAGIWNGTCYVKVADPQPDKDHPVWAGHEDDDGVIIQCTAYDAERMDCDADGGCGPGVSLRWAAGPPDEGPSPAELARRAVAQMNLAAGDIGITPNNAEPAIYGFPTWLWVDNPAENTTGPITTSASDGDLTVTATATLDRIEYAMGDGGSVTCAGDDAPGTPYDPSYDPPGTTGADAAISPTCGYMYTNTSAGQPSDAFTITATSYWTVEWSGGGQTGTIPIDLSTSRQHQVAEVQVILTTPNT